MTDDRSDAWYDRPHALVRRPPAAYGAEVELFSHSWQALRAAIAALPDEDFEKPSGCTGWLVRDLVCHLVIDAQDVLITLVTPTASEPTADAVTYWELLDAPPTGEDPSTR